MVRALIPCAALAAAGLLAGAARAEAPRFGPFPTPAAPVTGELRAPAPGARSEAAGRAHFLWPAFRLYARLVSPVDGPRCPHVPTCSAYAEEAVDRFGLRGLAMSVDRFWLGSRSSRLRALPRDADGRLIHPVEGPAAAPPAEAGE